MRLSFYDGLLLARWRGCLKHDKVEHGSEDDTLYVDIDERQCSNCNNVKLLGSFYYNSKTRQTTVECRKCIEDRNAVRATTQEAAASQALAKVIQTQTGRKALSKVAAATSVDAMNIILESSGGVEAHYKRIARALKRTLRDPDPEVSIKGVRAALGFQRDVDKVQSEQVDVSGISAEEKLDIMRPYAVAMILEDAQFRAMLVNDPEIRNLLLADLGVTVIEGEVEAK